MGKNTLKVLRGSKDATLNRLKSEPWTFSNEEMDRLLFGFYRSGDLTTGDCWEICERRIAHRAATAQDLRTRLEGRLVMAVVRGDEQEKVCVERLLAQLERSQMRVVDDKKKNTPPEGGA